MLYVLALNVCTYFMLYFVIVLSYYTTTSCVASYPSYLCFDREWVNHGLWVLGTWFYEHPYCTSSNILYILVYIDFRQLGIDQGLVSIYVLCIKPTSLQKRRTQGTNQRRRRRSAVRGRMRRRRGRPARRRSRRWRRRRGPKRKRSPLWRRTKRIMASSFWAERTPPWYTPHHVDTSTLLIGFVNAHSNCACPVLPADPADGAGDHGARHQRLRHAGTHRVCGQHWGQQVHHPGVAHGHTPAGGRQVHTWFLLKLGKTSYLRAVLKLSFVRNAIAINPLYFTVCDNKDIYRYIYIYIYIYKMAPDLFPTY